MPSLIPPTVLPLPRELDGQVFVTRARWTSSRPHRHRELEFNLMLRGRAACAVNDRRYELRPGVLAWLFAEHSHLLLQQSDDFEMWVAVFRPKLVHSLARTPESTELCAANPAGSFCRQLPVDSFRRLDQLCRNVSAAANDPPRHNAGLGYLLLEAWNIYQASKNALAGAELHPAVERLAQFLSSDRRDDEFDKLAHDSGLSASRLGRLFKQQMGLSVAEFRNRQRIQRFIDLYGTGQRKTVLRAALEAGFGSYTQFHRIFSNITGYSPREHQRRVRENPYTGTRRSAADSNNE
jgi:AraC-like DNA-binding protein